MGITRAAMASVHEVAVMKARNTDGNTRDSSGGHMCRAGTRIVSLARIIALTSLGVVPAISARPRAWVSPHLPLPMWSLLATERESPPRPVSRRVLFGSGNLHVLGRHPEHHVLRVLEDAQQRRRVALDESSADGRPAALLRVGHVPEVHHGAAGPGGDRGRRLRRRNRNMETYRTGETTTAHS